MPGKGAPDTPWAEDATNSLTILILTFPFIDNIFKSIIYIHIYTYIYIYIHITYLFKYIYSYFYIQSGLTRWNYLERASFHFSIYLALLPSGGCQVFTFSFVSIYMAPLRIVHGAGAPLTLRSGGGGSVDVHWSQGRRGGRNPFWEGWINGFHSIAVYPPPLKHARR